MIRLLCDDNMSFCDYDDRRLTTAIWANLEGTEEKCSGRRKARRTVIVMRQRPGYTELHFTLCTAVSPAREVILGFNHILSSAVLYLLVCILDSPGMLDRWAGRESTGFAVVLVSEYYLRCWIQPKHVSSCDSQSVLHILVL